MGAAVHARAGAAQPFRARIEVIPLPRARSAGRDLSARWDPVVIRMDAETLTAIARKVLAGVPAINGVAVNLAPGELSLSLTVRRFGVPLSARAVLSQIRLREGMLAFVLERAQALSFLPVPDSVVAAVVERARPGLVTFYRADRILVVNLADWMPPGLDLSLDSVEITSEEAVFHFAPGAMNLAEIL